MDCYNVSHLANPTFTVNIQRRGGSRNFLAEAPRPRHCSTARRQVEYACSEFWIIHNTILIF